ncbi:hypothetical protein C1J00_43385, partial [Streptomyces cahuitamycinicus]
MWLVSVISLVVTAWAGPVGSAAVGSAAGTTVSAGAAPALTEAGGVPGTPQGAAGCAGISGA